MGSRLVYDLAVGLAEAGFRALRFDYRGVGRSEGKYGNGEGEADDASAVFDGLRNETGRAPVVVGYSFGGAVACHLAASRPVARLVLVATPLHLVHTNLAPIDDAKKVAADVTVVAGERDDLAPPDDARRLAAAFVPAARIVILPRAGHFLEPSHNPAALAAVLAALGA